MLQNFTIQDNGVTRTFTPKDYPSVRIVVNSANNFTTVKLGGGKKDFFDNVKSDKTLDEEVNRILKRAIEKL